MQSKTKRQLSAEQLDSLLRTSTGVGCRLDAELTDGWFNAAYRVSLDDGRPAVVKIAPPAEAPVLRYERGILATEIMLYQRLSAVGDGVPTPELLYCGEDFLVLSFLEGTPWDKAADGMPPATSAALRRELGRIVAHLHRVTPPDGLFGYPAAAGLSAGDWRTAFSAMVEAALEDAARWGSPLTLPADDVRTLVEEGGKALDEVTEPSLVHFDLWPGNIFVRLEEGASAAGITGLIDHERAFWGDPVAEFVSLAFGSDAGPDSDLVQGYLEAGGRIDFTPAVRHRLALYGIYLGLLLVVECGPRGYGEDHLAFGRRYLDERLAELRALG